MPELVIDDQNWQQHVTPPPGRLTGLVARDWDRARYGSAGTKFEEANIPLVPRSEWRDRIAEMERTKSRLSDICTQSGVPVLDQNGLGYCHGFSAVGAVMALRAMMGEPTVKMSGSSVAAPVVGFVNSGAWIMDDLTQLRQYGCCPVEVYPEQTTKREFWTPENRNVAAKYRVSEWYELESRNFDQTMSVLFARLPVCVGLNYWGHAVWFSDPVYQNGQYGVRFRNSWGASYGTDGWAVLLGDKAIPDEAYVPRVTAATC